MCEVDAVERDCTFGRFDDAQDAASDGGLARAALADKPEGLAASDREGDAVDGIDGTLATAQREVLDKAVDANDRLRGRAIVADHGNDSSGWRASRAASNNRWL